MGGRVLHGQGRSGAEGAHRVPLGATATGEVSRLGRESDRETREFLINVRVTELPKNWAIGQRAEVYLQPAP